MKQDKKFFSITFKLFALLVLVGTMIYGLGILLVTPDISPRFLKYIFIGGMIAIEILFVIYYIKKKSDDPADERFYTNLLKAGAMTFFFSLVILLILALLLLSGFLKSLSAGVLFLIIALLILVCSLVFMSLEKR